MTKIKSISELEKIRKKAQQNYYSEKTDDRIVLIKVGMSTCGIASGAREIMRTLQEECEYQAVDVQIKQTGCLGYCYAEPMVEVQLPNSPPKVFGFVDKRRAKEIIEKYVMKGENVEGQIELSFRTIND
jgi:NADP-reducing hydrogenase subunit HndB